MPFETEWAAATPDMFTEFGESGCTATPASGTERTGLTFIIDREPAEPIEEDDRVFVPRAIVQIRNSATLGLTQQEVLAGATIKFKLRYGDTGNTTFTLGPRDLMPNRSDSGTTTVIIR